MMDQEDQQSSGGSRFTAISTMLRYIVRPTGNGVHLIVLHGDTGRLSRRTVCSMMRRFSWTAFETIPRDKIPCSRCWERGAAKGWVNTL